MVAELAAFGLDGNGAEPPVQATSPREAQLAYCTEAEVGFEGLFAALVEGLPPVAGVEVETRTIAGAGGHDVRLYVHRPAGAGPLPCVFHIHGGGMVLLSGAGPAYTRWRDELAATGLVVVGVEFRNAGGALGPHPFPAGLEDCSSALRWVLENKAELGATTVVVSGESGGGNLTLALTHRAKREGWLDGIDGVYAQCPYIHGDWADPSELPSLRENDGYFISCAQMVVLAELYDPGGAHAGDPTCWPLRATPEDLAGMPPHVISVNELDPSETRGWRTTARSWPRACPPSAGR